MSRPTRDNPVQRGLEHALHSIPRTRNPYTRHTISWVHYIVGYQYGLRILAQHRAAPFLLIH